MRSRQIEIVGNVIFWALTAPLISHGYGVYAYEIAENSEHLVITRNWETFRQLSSVVIASFIFFYANVWEYNKLESSSGLSKAFLKSFLYSSVIVMIYFIGRLNYFSPIKTPIHHITLAGIFLFYFIVSQAYGFGKMLLKTEQQKKRLDLEKKAAELHVLRSQLHPHFLFNVLNNLLAMVDQTQSPKLAGAIDQLSQMLRYVVYDVGEKLVPITKEIDFIRNYAKLQETRFENEEVEFELNVRGGFDTQPIEPGLFIPFVENAFKHGVRPETKSKINTSFDLSQPDRIVFNISNPNRSTNSSINGQGSGIHLTKQRLELTYPNRHGITIVAGNDFEVFVQINTDENDNC